MFCFLLESEMASTLIVIPINQISIQVSWKKPFVPVSGYKISCFSDGCDDVEITKEIDDPSKETEFVSGLTPESVYKVVLTSIYEDKRLSEKIGEEEIRMR